MGQVKEAYEAVLGRVLALRDAESGVWTGELASSALGTALALAALHDSGQPSDRTFSEAGAKWLAAHANDDGGWGDTPESPSNLSTTLIAAAALRKAEVGGRRSECLAGAEQWIEGRVGGPATPESIARALTAVYGQDRTFAVPILAFLAMCDAGEQAWRSIPPLPFLLALLPQGLYRFVRLQVVSYALPALIAVGLCRHVCAAHARNRWAWGRLFAAGLLRKLSALQPSHGGFLDAIPLTAFVCLSLRRAGYGDHAVAQNGLSFLRRSARADGSWAIDSNLRTWVTTLATRALTSGRCRLAPADGERIAAWLVKTQTQARHPFTGARPGGWAWTDWPGGVPDADDTAGALIALRRLKEAGCRTDMSAAVAGGLRWLLALQNADGGLPTFCRGWGRLPFDRSSPDISAHALSALAAWRGEARQEASSLARAVDRLLAYLGRTQGPDGSWVPLWFGHQEAERGRNPVVGTARVVDALRAASRARLEAPGLEALLARGERWLLGAQCADGGWGMGRAATVEETALAVIALAGGGGSCREAVRRGRAWLAEKSIDELERAAPIGLYFAVLWYGERLYPLVWALEALGLNEENEVNDGR